MIDQSSTSPLDMVEVTLYTKAGCHLCEEVKAELERLTAVYPHHLTEIDITTDRDVFNRYHLTIPVVHAGQTELEAPITADQLKAVLQAAAGQQAQRKDA